MSVQGPKQMMQRFTASTEPVFYRARISMTALVELMVRSRTKHNAVTKEQFTYTYSTPYSMLVMREPAEEPKDYLRDHL